MTNLQRMLLLTIAGVVPAFPDIMSVQPPFVAMDAGQHFAVSIRIDGATDLTAYQLDLGYDPAVLAADSVTEGAFLKAFGATIFLPASIDNGTGVISFVGGLLLTGSASGAGTLATVDFTAKAPGTTALTIFNTIALDSFGGDIAVTTTAGSVTVGNAPVPEPASLLLLLTAAGALAAFRRRRNAG